MDLKTVRRRRGGKRATGTWAPMAVPKGPIQRWSLDFVADALSWDRRFDLRAARLIAAPQIEYL